MTQIELLVKDVIEREHMGDFDKVSHIKLRLTSRGLEISWLMRCNDELKKQSAYFTFTGIRLEESKGNQ
jgi:hypothetical protein